MPPYISEFVAVVVADAGDRRVGVTGVGIGGGRSYSGCLSSHLGSEVPRGASDLNPASLISSPPQNTP